MTMAAPAGRLLLTATATVAAAVKRRRRHRYRRRSAPRAQHARAPARARPPAQFSSRRRCIAPTHHSLAVLLFSTKCKIYTRYEATYKPKTKSTRRLQAFAHTKIFAHRSHVANGDRHPVKQNVTAIIDYDRVCKRVNLHNKINGAASPIHAKF